MAENNSEGTALCRRRAGGMLLGRRGSGRRCDDGRRRSIGVRARWAGGSEWGGRVSREARLPGIAAWARVRDWRLGQLKNLSNAEMYLQSPLSADDILAYGIAHVALATGGRWRADGVGRTHRRPLHFIAEGAVVTPDDMMDRGAAAVADRGPVVIFDDDWFYMGSLMAEVAARAGREVTLVTSDVMVGSFSQNTLEQIRIQKQLLALGVRLLPNQALAGRGSDWLDLACTYSGTARRIDCGVLVPVTARLPVATLWDELKARESEWADAGLKSVTRIGDCLAPGTIAAANHSGHLYARTYGEVPDPDATPFRREDLARIYRDIARQVWAAVEGGAGAGPAPWNAWPMTRKRRISS